MKNVPSFAYYLNPCFYSLLFLEWVFVRCWKLAETCLHVPYVPSILCNSPVRWKLSGGRDVSKACTKPLLWFLNVQPEEKLKALQWIINNIYWIYNFRPHDHFMCIGFYNSWGLTSYRCHVKMKYRGALSCTCINDSLSLLYW